MSDNFERLYRPRTYEDRNFIILDDAVPRDRQFWVEPDVKGGPEFTLAHIAPLFLGQSASWIKTLHGRDPRAEGAVPRQSKYTLFHVEQIIHNLVHLEIISAMSARYGLLIVKYMALQHALIGMEDL